MLHSPIVTGGPGSVELPRSARADREGKRSRCSSSISNVRISRSAEQYLRDFGLLVVSTQRGRDVPARNQLAALRLSRDARSQARFVGLGLSGPAARRIFDATVEDVQRVRSSRSAGPGGGSVVRLLDPEGVEVDVLHGFTQLEPSSDPAAIPAQRAEPDRAGERHAASRARAAAGHEARSSRARNAGLRQKRALVHGHARLHSLRRHVPAGRNAGRRVHAARPRRRADGPSHGVRRVGARIEGRSRRVRGRRPRRGRNGPAGDDGGKLPARLGRRPTSARQPDLRLLARPVGPEARALRRRRPVRFDGSRPAITCSTARGSISGAPICRTTSSTPSSRRSRLVSVLKTALTDRPRLKKMLALKEQRREAGASVAVNASADRSKGQSMAIENLSDIARD